MCSVFTFNVFKINLQLRKQRDSNPQSISEQRFSRPSDYQLSHTSLFDTYKRIFTTIKKLFQPYCKLGISYVTNFSIHISNIQHPVQSRLQKDTLPTDVQLSILLCYVRQLSLSLCEYP